MLSFGSRAVCILALVATAQTSPSLSQFSKRSDGGMSPITVPLTMEASWRYVAKVNMSSGPETQYFSLAISTGTGYTMVAGSTCDSCGGVPSYNPSVSTSARAMAGFESVGILNTTVQGSTYKEDCGMQTINGGVWKYPNQTIVVANASDPVFSNGVSGILGLGTNSVQGNFFDTIFGAYMSSNASDNNFQYGMALNAPDNSTSNGGVLHLLSPDPLAYTGNVSWKGVQQMSSSDMNSTGLSSDWIISLDGWAFTGGSGSVTNNQGGACTVDPYYPNVYLPLNLATEIYGSISGASRFSDSATSAEAWTVPCGTKMTFTAIFGTESFSVDESILVINQGERCVGAIEGWSNSSLTGYLFGARFLSEIYLIFNVNNPDSSVPNSIGFAHKAQPSKKVDLGAIVGGTIGGVVFLGIVCGVGSFLYRRRSRLWPRKRQSEINPFTAVATSASTFKDGSVFATQQQAAQLPLLHNPELSSANTSNAYFPGTYQPRASAPMSVQRISTSSQNLNINAPPSLPRSAPPNTQSFQQADGLTVIHEVHSIGDRPHCFSAPNTPSVVDAPPDYTPPEEARRQPRKS
ncbi:acid protease [Neolentinus lepideus HHB14362 ss-1]|uniref:Acid protease n=1 Tax=Neolentinus lepideus HHB14362 ss-1 TaxID=1314782 RepID=A0A165Q8U6_9AGAM|nr:acid protease [Neolentinus lepideus HHB14362 ss-1]